MGELSWRLLALGPSLGKRCRPKRCPSSPTLSFQCHRLGRGADRRRGQPGRLGGWGRISPPGSRQRLLLQHKVLSVASLAQLLQRSLPAPGRPKWAVPGWATLIVCHRNVSGARARQAGRGDGRGWGLRVPPSAPPALSGHRQGDVKGFGGVGCLEVGVGQGRWPRGSASLRSSLPLGWAVRRGRCGGRSCLPEA